MSQQPYQQPNQYRQQSYRRTESASLGDDINARRSSRSTSPSVAHGQTSVTRNLDSRAPRTTRSTNPHAPRTTRSRPTPSNPLHALIDNIAAWNKPPWLIPLIGVIVLLILVLIVVNACAGCQQTNETNTTATHDTKTVDQALEAGGTAFDGSANVTTAFAAYSWEELDRIAQELSNSGSKEAALDIARQYRLVNDDGKLTGDCKSITLTDGTAAAIQIADFYHDDKAAGGKAGITFIVRNCMPTKLAMNASGNNDGGWDLSDLRAALPTRIESTMPTELTGVIKPVSKATNNTGASDNNDVITLTNDSLWLFSKTELVGTIAESDLTNSAVLNQEGTQYQLFSDAGVTNAMASPMLSKSLDGEEAIWWTRSSVLDLENGYYVVIGTGSAEDFSYYADNEYGVVVGFCL